MSIFNKTINCTINNLPKEFETLVTQWATLKNGNMSCAVSGTTCSLTIDEDTCAFSFPTTGNYSGSYQWSITICDAPDYECCTILNRESFSGIDGNNTSSADQRYNLIICKYNGALKCLNSVSIDGFSLSDLFNIPKGRYNITSSTDVYITRALVNSNLASANTINISDNLYLSTNLINVGVKTIVKSKEDTSKQFINIGGVFYLPYSSSILTISAKEPSVESTTE